MNPNLSYKEILELVDAVDPTIYAKTRNHLRGAVTKLSPYITRGVISLPAIRDRVLQKYSYAEAEKFLQELAWREYFQKVYLAKGKDIFTDLRFTRQDWRHQDLVKGIVEAKTGIEAIDKEIKQMYETGYMHNHARMWTAMLSSNVAKAHWLQMSKWMYYHLLDGDLASNTISWQWVAGTAAHKRYVADQKLINGCSDTKQSNTYLDIDREEVLAISLPGELEARVTFDYQTPYPENDTISSLKDEKVFIYHPWSIDPLWRKEEEGKRIFVIEPRLFDKFPVSSLVMQHMLTLLRVHVPDAQIFVGNIETLPDIEKAQVFSKRHPATQHYPGTQDRGEELYPEVQGYFTSFFNFWKACNS